MHAQPTSHAARGGTSVLLAALGVLLLGLMAAGPASGTAPARAARTLRATDEAQMRYIKSKSSATRIFEEGTARGTLPGNMRAYLSLGAEFTATFTIFTHGGTINGHGTARPHGGGLYESFAGTLTVTGGTGRYAHAHGHAGLYGTFNRRNYVLVVQTTGSLAY